MTASSVCILAIPVYILSSPPPHNSHPTNNFRISLCCGQHLHGLNVPYIDRHFFCNGVSHRFELAVSYLYKLLFLLSFLGALLQDLSISSCFLSFILPLIRYVKHLCRCFLTIVAYTKALTGKLGS
ncbi:hypothetical protein HOY80DRAFT_737777 [Tuber brumale]|nr:hypothetical protein HOY80DRAFT_737777 [Tuber brumale]